MEYSDNRVLVIGGGIAGIQASLDLGEIGFKVDLIEKEACIGGRMAQLDKTLPTNDCSICILAPKLSDCLRHPNITIHSLSEVQKINRIDKKFHVSIKNKSRFVDEDLCINCGECVEVCPTKVDDEFDMNMRKRKAIYLYYLQGVPAIMAIDKEHCIYIINREKGKDICRQCQKVCPKDAINFKQTGEINDIETNAIIIATGSNQMIPKSIKKYGYGKYQNIITGLEYERMISASGPTSGFIKRISDDKHPKEIAFIQCVGSRDIKTNPYCSSICCTYATKHAILSKEHDTKLKTYIFYIDLRAGGKGFQKYIKRAKEDYDVKYIRGIVSDITIDENENPILNYENLNSYKIQTKKVGLVILSSAMIPSKGIKKFSNRLNIKLNKYNFIKSNLKNPLNTNLPGIFACGSSLGPMDIPHSVIGGSGAAAKAAEYIFKING